MCRFSKERETIIIIIIIIVIIIIALDRQETHQQRPE